MTASGCQQHQINVPRFLSRIDYDLSWGKNSCHFNSTTSVSWRFDELRCFRVVPTSLVHSHYFDTYDFKAFTDSEEGLLPRRKVRLRYYGAGKIVPDHYSLETKISSVEGRFQNHKISRVQWEEEVKDRDIWHSTRSHISGFESLLQAFISEIRALQNHSWHFDLLSASEYARAFGSRSL